MPIQVFSFSMRVNGNGGSTRCADRQEAEKIYSNVFEQLKSGDDFVTLTIGDDVNSIRAKDISSFGINVHLEQTAEEIKAQRIAQIESGYDNGYAGNHCTSGALMGGNLLKGY